ncbi:hypothetical protein D3C73_1056350 [compost metagenome]
MLKLKAKLGQRTQIGRPDLDIGYFIVNGEHLHVPYIFERCSGYNMIQTLDNLQLLGGKLTGGQILVLFRRSSAAVPLRWNPAARGDGDFIHFEVAVHFVGNIDLGRLADA